MKKHLVIGKREGEDFEIDLPYFLETRALIQANSGGGKSYLIRRLLEQSHGQVQQIVIDLEGEFSTLREKFDYVLVGKGGDAPATTRSAALLARKLLELKVSAVIDLSELQHHERKHYVKLFLDSMIDAPKELWTPVMVVIDEAHQFAPEKGESEAASAVIDLMTRGRKRGYCGVLATQRISKLAKDAAAEANNKLIGRSSQDIDMKRASEELGFTSKADTLSLRNLKAGEFYAFGAAMCPTPTKIQVGGVQTSHPKVGTRALTHVAPASTKIRSVLGKLADLPAEAEQKVKTEKALKEEITDLKRQIAQKIVQNDPKGGVKVEIKKILVPTVGKKTLAAFKKVEENMSRMVAAAKKQGIAAAAVEGAVVSAMGILAAEMLKVEGVAVKPPVVQTYAEPAKPMQTRVAGAPIKPGAVFVGKDEKVYNTPETSLKEGARKMLYILRVRHPDRLTRAQWGTLVGFKASGGTFGTYISNLRAAGLVDDSGGTFGVTQAGLEYPLTDTVPETPEEKQAMWRGRFKEGARKMFDVIIQHYPNPITKELLGQALDMVHTGGTFGTYLSNMRSAGVITIHGQDLRASDDLF